jgi:ferredoxin
MTFLKGMMSLKATIDRDGCISCGLCAETCPAVFNMASDGLAEVIVDFIPDSEKDKAEEARDACPVSVISIG